MPSARPLLRGATVLLALAAPACALVLGAQELPEAADAGAGSASSASSTASVSSSSSASSSSSSASSSSSSSSSSASSSSSSSSSSSGGCPIAPEPDGGNCPAPCNGGCDAGMCVIDCTMDNQCKGHMIQCPPGLPCKVECGGAQSCAMATVACPPLYGCLVDCDAVKPQACQATIVDCSNEGPCELSCGAGPQACQQAVMRCSAGACRATCVGPDTPAVECDAACACKGC